MKLITLVRLLAGLLAAAPLLARAEMAVQSVAEIRSAAAAFVTTQLANGAHAEAAALDERVLYLTRSMGATWWQTFRYVRLPAAMSYIFLCWKHFPSQLVQATLFFGLLAACWNSGMALSIIVLRK